MNSKKAKWIVALAFILFSGVTVFMFWTYPLQEGAIRSNELTKRRIDSFTFIRSDGKSVTEKDFSGSYAVIDFIFTRCAMTCPTMSAEMKRIQDRFHSKKNLKLLSVSVDPSDTPSELQKYAKRFEADPAKWIFATGESEKIESFATKTLTLSAQDAPSLHSTYFVLVSDKGEILGHYNSEDRKSLDVLYSLLEERLTS